MEGETLRADGFAQPQHRRDLGLHRGVRARHDLADAVGSSAHAASVSLFSFSAITAFSATLSSLPTRVMGNASIVSTRSGHLNLARPLPTRNSASSLTAGALFPGRGMMKMHPFSP